MCDGIRTGFFGDLNQTLGDQRACDGSTQQIQPLVDRIGAEHGENEIAHEFFAQVFDIDGGCAHHLGLGAGGFQFLALAQIGGECHHLATVFGLKPF
jgi:hypothetical protein